jgi:hypothetical protein
VLGRRREATDAVVARLLLASNDEGLQTAGLRILARNAVSAPIPAEFFTGSSATLAEAAYRWKLSIDHARAVTELRNRIADERARYVSAVLADAQLMDRDLAFFRRLCSAGVTERQRALEVLAVYAPTDEVLDLLTSPDAFERNVVQPWIAGRADLGRLIDGASKRVAANPTAPGSVSLLRAFAQTRTELQQEVDALPTSLQPWIASVMLQANENAPSGIRHWIEQKANP